MTYEVDFTNVSTIELEWSPLAGALAGLRANEARYFKNKYGHAFAVEPASKAQTTIDWPERSSRDRPPPARGSSRGRFPRPRAHFRFGLRSRLALAHLA
jgi:hypothetical protein